MVLPVCLAHLARIWALMLPVARNVLQVSIPLLPGLLHAMLVLRVLMLLKLVLPIVLLVFLVLSTLRWVPLLVNYVQPIPMLLNLAPAAVLLVQWMVRQVLLSTPVVLLLLVHLVRFINMVHLTVWPVL